MRYLTPLAAGVLLVACGSPTERIIPVTSVTFNTQALTTVPGAKVQPTVYVAAPPGAPAAPVEFTSSNHAVATVDAAAVITAVGEGTATIVARAADKADTLLLTVAYVRFREVGLGSGRTCAISTNDEIYCWGLIELIDITPGLPDGARAMTVRAPVRLVASMPGVTGLAVGGDQVCALAGGAVSCWGSNRFGVLGRGTEDTLFHGPAAIAGFGAAGAITASALFTCGLSGGGAFCWGYNSLGQIGDGTTTNRAVPTAVAGLTGVTAVGAGHVGACALDGLKRLYCWGGELGANPAMVDSASQFQVLSVWGQGGCALKANGLASCWGYDVIPTQVSGGIAMSQVTSADSHHCGLDAAGKAYCWGGNAHGELGLGTVDETVYAAPQVVTGDHRYALLRSGGASTCGLSGTGLLYCWGANVYGEVGDASPPTAVTLATPTLVVGQAP